MLFARYNGDNTKTLMGGVVYIADQSTFRAVDQNKLSIRLESGKWVDVSEQMDSFEPLDSIYAVWLGVGPEPKPGSEKGMVFCIVDVDINGKTMYRIEGNGYHLSDNFEILDERNFIPGMFVLDKSTGVWNKISRIESGDWMISIDSDPAMMRSVTDFIFAVNDNGIMFSPLVQYQGPHPNPYNLVSRQWYQLVETLGDRVVVLNDKNEQVSVDKKSFLGV